MCMCIELDVEYFSFPTWHHSWMNARHDRFWSLGKAINWYRLRRDMIRPISPQAVAEIVFWCGGMIWGCIRLKCRISMLPTMLRLQCICQGLLIMFGWPQKVNQRRIQNSPFNLSLSLSRGIFEIWLKWSWNQHFWAWALTEVSCLQGAGCFQGSTSSKFYPGTAGRAYFVTSSVATYQQYKGSKRRLPILIHSNMY